MKALPILFLTIALYGLSSCKVKDYASSSQPVDHQLWDELLQAHVSPNGNVDYKGFIQDSLKLNRYLDQLKRNHPNPDNWSQEEQLAYWINAYNAFTIELVNQYYPVESIKDIKKGIPFINSVWDLKFIQIEEATYDLNNIEHGIIRARFEEPRIHFALNCASFSCPQLHDRAFLPQQLEEQLEMVTKRFINDPTKNVIGTEQVQLSKIFSWYGGDFKKNGTKIDFINQYATNKIPENAKLDFLPYNWSLNE